RRPREQRRPDLGRSVLLRIVLRLPRVTGSGRESASGGARRLRRRIPASARTRTGRVERGGMGARRGTPRARARGLMPERASAYEPTLGTTAPLVGVRLRQHRELAANVVWLLGSNAAYAASQW